MDFRNIKICRVEDYENIRKDLINKKSQIIDKNKIIENIKEKKKDKLIKKDMEEENGLTQQQKKERCVKKIISMRNNDKPLLDIQKKIGRLLDKYYIKKVKLDF